MSETEKHTSGNDEADGKLLQCLGFQKKGDKEEKYSYGQTESGGIVTSPHDVGSSQENGASGGKREIVFSFNPVMPGADVFSNKKPKTAENNQEPVMASNKAKGLPRYVFDKPHRGLAIVVAQEKFAFGSDRIGAKQDGWRAKRMFEKMGYTVKGYENLKFDAFRNILRWATLGHGFDHARCDSFAFAMFTHGGFDDKEEEPNVKFHRDFFETCDNKKMETRELIDLFKDTNCPSLKGKPKLFFIQACRGGGSSKGATVYTRKDEPSQPKKPNKESIPVPVEPNKLIQPLPTSYNQKTPITNDGFVNLERAVNELALNVADLPDTVDFSDFDVNQCEDAKMEVDPGDTPDVERCSTPPHFSMQAGGGDEPDPDTFPDPHTAANTIPEEPYTVRPIPGYKDFLILNASPPGGYAWKKGEKGTPFSMELYEEMYEKFSENRSLYNMITKAMNNMAIKFETHNAQNHQWHGIKQTMSLNSMLTGEVFFKKKDPFKESAI